MERVIERVALARRALATLAELVKLPAPSVVERDAAIQRFAYSFEAVWKAVQLHLKQVEGLVMTSPKGVIRASLQTGLLDEAETRQALQMVDDRNLTSHTYHEDLAKLIFSRVSDHARLMQIWVERLGARLTALGR